jgi:uncharacterized membrane protein YdbT with pleckstrin-like domain
MTSPLSPTAGERTVWQGTPSPLMHLPTFLLLGVAAIGATIGLTILRGGMAAAPARIGDPDPRGVVTWVIALAWIVCGVGALSVYLRTITTRYHVTSERLRITTGLFSTNTEEVELRRVRDSSIQKPFLFRMLGLGNITLNTADTSAPRVTLQAVPDPDTLQSQIRELVQGFYARRAVTDIEIG